MVAFWDKIKSVAKDAEEKKEETPKKDVSKVVDVKKEDSKVKSSKKKVIKEEKKEKKSKKKGKKVKKRNLKAHEAHLVNKVLVRPKISEAVMNQQMLGKYVFEVSREAKKSEIAKAVESMYGVSVVKVNTLCYKPKTHGFRGRSGMKSGFKKAIVTLKQGESIEMFKEAK
ncbi:MAG: 50S ribosomal protein L23 [Patescibacteria group bacterium]|nr:50S ribosomal protein L23 [Patescibacteria group bacterium]